MSRTLRLLLILLRIVRFVPGESLHMKHLAVCFLRLRLLLPFLRPHSESSSYEASESARASICNKTLDKFCINVRCRNLGSSPIGIVFVLTANRILTRQNRLGVSHSAPSSSRASFVSRPLALLLQRPARLSYYSSSS